MKIHVLGDLHLEFGAYTPAQVDADVVVLAGDIHTRAMAIPWIQNHYPALTVVYVAGNHEYYRKALPEMDETLQGAAWKKWSSLAIASFWLVVRSAFVEPIKVSKVLI